MAKVNTAFHPRTENQINNAISSLHTRVLRTLDVPRIDYRELLQLIAPSEHIDFLLKARQIADISRYSGVKSDAQIIAQHRKRNVAVEFEVSGDDYCMIMPNKTLWLDRSPENRDLAMELVSCAKRYADVQTEWDEVKNTFRHLNNVCKTPAQVRYLWPAISGILSMDDNLSGMRAQLSQHTIPARLPTLPMEVRAMCRRTAATVAMALMLPALEDDAVPTPEVEITFRLMDFFAD